MNREQISIGNWISYEDKPYQIAGIGKSMESEKDWVLELNGVDFLIPIEEAKPIPITDFWLAKLKFHRNLGADKSVYTKKEIYIEMQQDEIVCVKIFNMPIDLKHVHQFQNLLALDLLSYQINKRNNA